MYTLESSSILQLLDSISNHPQKLAPRSPGPAPGLDESLIQLIQREALDRIDGDFLELGLGSGKLAAISASVGKRMWVVQRDSGKLPQGTALAFAFVDGNHDPASVKSDFRLVWSHLVARGWVGFQNYAGDLPEVTNALNAMLTEHSAEIDRVERIKDKRVLLVRKRTARIETDNCS